MPLTPTASLTTSSPAVATPPADEILTVAEVAEIIRCKPSSVYNLTRKRGAARYAHPIPHIKLPCGLRFRKSSVIEWLYHQATCGIPST
jgi:predicted DNA-binding transcriptional regulator AlpA